MTHRYAVPGVVERHGRRWRVAYAGRCVVVDHLVGMLHLAVLTANPGQEIPAAELASGVEAVVGGSSRQALLDQSAIRQYRARLAQLREQADDEHDWLVRQLAAASGLRGRTRGFTDNAERARIAVGKAIRRAIDRIHQADPALGAYLRDTVHTGIRCVYLPI